MLLHKQQDVIQYLFEENLSNIIFIVFFQVECISYIGFYIYIGKEKYLCEYQGQNLTVLTTEYDSIYVGSIICPDCQIICGSLVCFNINL